MAGATRKVSAGLRLSSAVAWEVARMLQVSWGLLLCLSEPSQVPETAGRGLQPSALSLRLGWLSPLSQWCFLTIHLGREERHLLVSSGSAGGSLAPACFQRPSGWKWPGTQQGKAPCVCSSPKAQQCKQFGGTCINHKFGTGDLPPAWQGWRMGRLRAIQMQPPTQQSVAKQ